MSKKKIVPKTLNIYSNIILNTDSDLVSGIVICDINDINLNINITNSNEGNYSISIPEKDIGYGKKTGYRVKYPDDGTINQSPQNFKEKTINEMTPKIQKLYAERIKEGLKL